ncbi:MAG: DUF4272 domain-containing protein [Pseudomonadota bacterium]|nr:DUF4272 domain-containing protein [Pseudomonadota bacterium]
MINAEKVRQHTVQRLRELEVPLHPHLPFIDGRLKRTPVEIAERIVGLYAMLGIGRDADPDLLWNWMEENGFLSFLSDAEMEIMQKEKFTEANINICSWKQESLFVLGWFVNIESDMGLPSEESDLDELFTMIPPEVEFQTMIDSFRLKSEESLLETLDFYYCLHAAIKHPELWESEKQMRNVKFAAVEERRRALEWLVSADNNWDNITLDT